MKRAIALLLTFAAIFALCGCGSSSSNNDTKIKNENQAIIAAKNSIPTENTIAKALGFVLYSHPDYGVCSAKQRDNGTWDVTLKGKMTGSLNETKTDIKTYGFEYNVNVDSTIGYFIGSAKKVK